MREGTRCHFESCFTGREIFQTGLNKINKVLLRPPYAAIGGTIGGTRDTIGGTVRKFIKFFYFFFKKIAKNFVYNNMRKPRFTYKGAFHHVMNRGHNKSNIFPASADKKYFINLLHQRASLLKIRIFAFCIMDNHYHIIIQNSSGKLSDFMKQLNGIYATYFRKKYGGVGYVFQNRYKSTLIQNEKYLSTAIAYTLYNPVRAGVVDNVFNYKYSSINEYYNNSININNYITDVAFVEDIFQSKDNFLFIVMSANIKVEEKNSHIGKVLGDEEYIEKIAEENNRRESIEEIHVKRRKDEYKYDFPGYKEVIKEFENMHRISVYKMDKHSIEWKRIRIKLLIEIREKCGLRYSEINLIDIFNTYKLDSLRSIYHIYRNKNYQ